MLLLLPVLYYLMLEFKCLVSVVHCGIFAFSNIFWLLLLTNYNVLYLQNRAK